MGKADIWQFTSSGSIPGVTGKVDINKFYTDFEDDIPSDREERMNINILDFQSAANVDGYRDASGAKLAEDGKDGPKTQYVRRQIVLKAQKSGQKYIVGSAGHVVKWWQGRCNEILGHRQAEDGLYGQAARRETFALQKKIGLKEDGIAGYNSINKEEKAVILFRK